MSYQNKGFQRLPEDVTVDKGIHDGKEAYIAHTREWDEIGGVMVSGTSDGDTHLEPYISKQIIGYSQAEKERLIADIAQQMTDVLIKHQAGKPEHLRDTVTPPSDIPPGTQVIESKCFPCSKCNDIVARLIFSWDSATGEEIEAMGEKFLLECISVDYPVWILGAPDSQDDSVAKHLTLQLAPNKGAVYFEHPDDMNTRLIALDDQHC